MNVVGDDDATPFQELVLPKVEIRRGRVVLCDAGGRQRRSTLKNGAETPAFGRRDAKEVGPETAGLALRLRHAIKEITERRRTISRKSHHEYGSLIGRELFLVAVLAIKP